MSSHGKQEITDPVEEMIKRTGCIELHYKVQVIIILQGIIEILVTYLMLKHFLSEFTA